MKGGYGDGYGLLVALMTVVIIVRHLDAGNQCIDPTVQVVASLDVIPFRGLRSPGQ